MSKVKTDQGTDICEMMKSRHPFNNKF